MANYSRKYIYIYITQSLGVILGLLSLFIVTPYLTSNKDLYGIYSLCISLTIFFAYADLGFISSGQKFAAESFIQGDRKHELEIIGFSGFILLSLLLLISVIFLLLSYNPDLLIRDLSHDNRYIAKDMMTILAIFSPVYGMQRIIQMYYSVRLNDYYCQIVNIVGNCIKILSVFYFFSSNKYDIVGYFLFFHLINLFSCLVQLFVAKMFFSLSIRELIKQIKYNRKVYIELKDLAFAGLFVTLCWIFYFELDNFAISFIWGAKLVAIYAIAFNVLAIFRNLFGILYSPFSARFNYFTGKGDISGLNCFIEYLVTLFYPVTIVPVIVVAVTATPFVMSWVGCGFNTSSQIIPFFMVSILFTFITTPVGIYLTARQKVNVLYANSIIITLLYWAGIICFKDVLGVYTFAIMKALAFVISAFYVIYIASSMISSFLYNILSRLLRSFLIPTILCVVFSYLVKPYMLVEQGKINLLQNIVIMLSLIILNYLCFIFFCRNYRAQIVGIIKSSLSR